MSKVSAGLLLYRRRGGILEVLLAHPGGPFWARKDSGVWTIPKGEVQAGEEMLAAACREFEEETGAQPHPPFVELGSITQRSGKIVHAWAFEDDFDPRGLHSGTYETEWPPGSGRTARFPEIDRAEFFDLDAARMKLIESQVELLSRLEEAVARRTSGGRASAVNSP